MKHTLNSMTQRSMADRLGAFFESLGMAMPAVELLDGVDVPPPYRGLLVNVNDMTPTLEMFHGCTLSLQVINKRMEGDCMIRQVVLVKDTDDSPTVYGVIRIFLKRFDDETRDLILACHKPLGGILASRAVPHYDRPSSFFAVKPDDAIASALRLTRRPTLFGRHDKLHNRHSQVLAEVVEFLPPIDTNGASQRK